MYVIVSCKHFLALIVVKGEEESKESESIRYSNVISWKKRFCIHIFNDKSFV